MFRELERVGDIPFGMFHMKDSTKQKRERKEQSNCYSKDSISTAGATEWFEVVADFLKNLKTEGATDDRE